MESVGDTPECTNLLLEVAIRFRVFCTQERTKILKGSQNSM